MSFKTGPFTGLIDRRFGTGVSIMASGVIIGAACVAGSLSSSIVLLALMLVLSSECTMSSGKKIKINRVQLFRDHFLIDVILCSEHKFNLTLARCSILICILFPVKKITFVSTTFQHFSFPFYGFFEQIYVL